MRSRSSQGLRSDLRQVRRALQPRRRGRSLDCDQLHWFRTFRVFDAIVRSCCCAFRFFDGFGLFRHCMYARFAISASCCIILARRKYSDRTVASVPCRSALSRLELSNVSSSMKKDVSWSKLSALWSIRPDHPTYNNNVLGCGRGVCVVQALAQSSLISWVVLYHLQKSRHRMSLRCSAQCDLCMLRGRLSPPPKTA